MKEIVVISGKGGTGKTSIVGSLAAIINNKVVADCDVDAANLHLLLQPAIQEKEDFVSGVKAVVENDRCSGCSTCSDLCQFEAVTMDDVARISNTSCEGCGVCAHFCPEQAIVLDDNHCGSVYHSDTAYGRFIHAQLFAGEENSGKLVSHVRKQARQTAEQESADYVLIDGAPGIGCPVIASVSNATALMVVTEPTRSGLHDLGRVLDLAAHFKVPAYVCLNRWDLHQPTSVLIEQECSRRSVSIIGRIPFDEAVVDSQLAGVPLVDFSNGPAAAAVRLLWREFEKKIEQAQ
ncbi:MAG: ATP-binding protein [Thermodesulfobacteriota bacterium]